MLTNFLVFAVAVLGATCIYCVLQIRTLLDLAKLQAKIRQDNKSKIDSLANNYQKLIKSHNSLIDTTKKIEGGLKNYLQDTNTRLAQRKLPKS